MSNPELDQFKKFLAPGVTVCWSDDQSSLRFTHPDGSVFIIDHIGDDASYITVDYRHRG